MHAWKTHVTHRAQMLNYALITLYGIGYHTRRMVTHINTTLWYHILPKESATII